jgi:hypothetical protein
MRWDRAICNGTSRDVSVSTASYRSYLDISRRHAKVWLLVRWWRAIFSGALVPVFLHFHGREERSDIWGWILRCFRSGLEVSIKWGAKERRLQHDSFGIFGMVVLKYVKMPSAPCCCILRVRSGFENHGWSNQFLGASCGLKNIKESTWINRFYVFWTVFSCILEVRKYFENVVAILLSIPNTKWIKVLTSVSWSHCSQLPADFLAFNVWRKSMFMFLGIFEEE